MTNQSSPVAQLWSREYSRQLKKNVPYAISEQFQKMAAIFSPGSSYYYIMNLQNLHLEYLSPEVENITGIPLEKASIQELLSVNLEEDVGKLIKKELVIKDFYIRYLSPEDITSYKIVYSYRMRDKKGTYRQILHQAVALSVSDEGSPQHVISIHSDVTYLKLPMNERVSFISLNNENRSYFNVDTEMEKFDPSFAEPKKVSLFTILSPREQEILNLLAKGHSADKIGQILHLSFNTVRTHRKNMLKKSGCTKTTELVARALMEGVLL